MSEENKKASPKIVGPYVGPIVKGPIGAVPIGQLVTKEGYVRRYWLGLEMNPTRKTKEGEAESYFRVIISSAPDEDVDIREFRLLRSVTNYVDVVQEGGFLSDIYNGEPLSIRWSSVSMAIIATLKDAFFSGKKVKVTGRYLPLHMRDTYVRLDTVEIMQ